MPTTAATKRKASGSAVPKEPKGRPVGGKTWKTARKRASSMAVVNNRVRPGYKATKERQQRDREIRERERELVSAVNREKEGQRLRREENEKRRAENEKKNTVVQVISNPRKLKRLSKKQSRDIRPLMDTSSLAKS